MSTRPAHMTAAARALKIQELDAALDRAYTGFNLLHGRTIARPKAIDYLEGFRGSLRWNEDFMR